MEYVCYMGVILTCKWIQERKIINYYLLYIIVLQICAKTYTSDRRFYNFLTSHILNNKLCNCNFRLQVASIDLHLSFRSHGIIPCFMSCVIPNGVPVPHSTRNVITVHFITCNKTVYSFFDRSTIAIHESCDMFTLMELGSVTNI